MEHSYLNQKRNFDFDSSIIDKVKSTQEPTPTPTPNQHQNNTSQLNLYKYEINEDRFENEIFEKDSSFSDFSFSKLILKALSDLKFFRPTKVQSKVIPIISQGHDVLLNSETGSGKTACFLLPLIQKRLKNKSSKALIIVPTRELAVQCTRMLSDLLKYIDSITYVTVTGGVSISSQVSELQKEPDFIISTPGRLIDMIYNQKSIILNYVNSLVLDEADKLLELGFKDAVCEIVNKLSMTSLHCLLFSATLNSNVLELGRVVLKNPVKLKLEHSALLLNLKQSMIRMAFKPKSNQDELEVEVKKDYINHKKKQRKNVYKSIINSDLEFNQRMSYLIHLLQDESKSRSIVFFNTKLECHKAFIILKKFMITSREMHSDIDHWQRASALKDFDENKVKFLLATDVIGRGIDVDNVKLVINFQMPVQSDRYVHRIGRTARKGNFGQAITICNSVDRTIFKRMIKKEAFQVDPIKISNEEVRKIFKSLKTMTNEVNSEMEVDYTDKQLLFGEMSLKKEVNFSENENEIYNRPKKNWFISKKGKEELKNKEMEMIERRIKKDKKDRK